MMAVTEEPEEGHVPVLNWTGDTDDYAPAVDVNWKEKLKVAGVLLFAAALSAGVTLAIIIAVEGAKS